MAAMEPKNISSQSKAVAHWNWSEQMYENGKERIARRKGGREIGEMKGEKEEQGERKLQ